MGSVFICACDVFSSRIRCKWKWSEEELFSRSCCLLASETQLANEYDKLFMPERWRASFSKCRLLRSRFGSAIYFNWLICKIYRESQGAGDLEKLTVLPAMVQWKFL